MEIKYTPKRARRIKLKPLARDLRAQGLTYMEIADTLELTYREARTWTLDVPKGKSL